MKGPCAATFSNIFRGINVELLEKKVGGWAENLLGVLKGRDSIDLDGKTAKDGGGDYVLVICHWLSARISLTFDTSITYIGTVPQSSMIINRNIAMKIRPFKETNTMSDNILLHRTGVQNKPSTWKPTLEENRQIHMEAIGQIAEARRSLSE